jgi:hypothetical protein
MKHVCLILVFCLLGQLVSFAQSETKPTKSKMPLGQTILFYKNRLSNYSAMAKFSNNVLFQISGIDGLIYQQRQLTEERSWSYMGLYLCIQRLSAGNKGLNNLLCRKKNQDLQEFVALEEKLVAMEFGGGKLVCFNKSKQIDANGILPGDALVVTKADLGKKTGVKWAGNNKFEAGATSDTDGASNTSKIVSVQGIRGAYAARLCSDCTDGGFTDWYLPSKNELNLLYQVKDTIEDFTLAYYWSSTEYCIYNAYDQSFDNGIQGDYNKSNTSCVRCVRRVLTFSDVDVLKKYTVDELKAGGYTSKVLLDRDFSLNELHAVGFKQADLFAANGLQIGAEYGGGNVIYVNNTKLTDRYSIEPGHCLIAMKTDSKGSVQWSAGKLIRVGTKSETRGWFNTYKIVDAQNSQATYAAQLCSESSEGGFTDWYLPSKDELNLLFTNKRYIGGLIAGSYWSSTEYDKQAAWYQFFSDGRQIYNSKFETSRVRCVRRY